MSGKDRINLFPSRANHVQMKGRIVSANKGLSLLKRKRDALEIKLREIIALRAGLAENFYDDYAEAIFAIAKANFLETDFKPALVIGSERADAFMRLNYAKTIGLLLPTFEPVIKKSESLPFTGLSRGGRQVDVIREKFQELLKAIILLASYDFSIRTLQDAIRSNNMRLNGLEFVVIPRFSNTINYISQELDEMEREEFYRLKRSQGKQRALKEKAKKKPDADGISFVDAETWTGDEPDEPTSSKEEIFVRLPLSIFMKKRYASSMQTLITGHYPGSNEYISPTLSLVSSQIPTVTKRSSFKPFEAPAKPTRRVSVVQEVDESKLRPSNDDAKPGWSGASSPNDTTYPLTKAQSHLNFAEDEAEANKREYPSTSAGTTARTSAEESSTAASSAVVRLNKFDESDPSRRPSVDIAETGVQTDISGRYPRRSEMTSPQMDWISDNSSSRSEMSCHGIGCNTEHGYTSGSDDDDEHKKQKSNAK